MVSVNDHNFNNYMKQNPSWEALSSSNSQKDSSSFFDAQWFIDLLERARHWFQFWGIYFFKIILVSTYKYSKRTLSIRFSPQNSLWIFSPMFATCPNNFILDIYPHHILSLSRQRRWNWADSFNVMSECFDACWSGWFRMVKIIWDDDDDDDYDDDNNNNLLSQKYRIMACLLTMHITDINTKFCVVNEILFLSSPLIFTYLFWFSALTLSSDF